MKYTLYIGLNDKDTKKQEISTIEAYKLVAREACGLVDGATIFEATGYYRHEDGTIVIEQSLRCEVFTDDRKAVLDLIDVLKRLLNQEAIIMQSEQVYSEAV